MKKHPFGHGKMEGISALMFRPSWYWAQAVLSSIRQYSALSTVQVIKPDAGIAVMVISIIASYFLSRHLRRVAKATESTAIDASAQNISADVYSAAGVLLGCWPCLLPLGNP